MAPGADAVAPTPTPNVEVWTTYMPAEISALGVPPDLVAAAGSAAAMFRVERASDAATVAELGAWALMSRLYAAHFGAPPTPRHARVERLDVAELAEALLVRPHRRTIASVSA